MKICSVLCALIVVLLFSCSPSRLVSRSARQNILDNQIFNTSHVGVSIYEPATGKYWYNYQGDKYFVPASNTKLPTCFAAMKYLGDSLDGLRVLETGQTLSLFPTGDPTLLHPDFTNQPVVAFLKNTSKALGFDFAGWEEQALGSGWSWSDYSEDYLSERSAMPVYGNLVHVTGTVENVHVWPAAFAKRFSPAQQGLEGYINSADRAFHANDFSFRTGGNKLTDVGVPFITSDSLSVSLLLDTIHRVSRMDVFRYGGMAGTIKGDRDYIIHSQPTDSMLKLMMHRSDNFFAEQSLLMVSRKLLHVFNDQKIIDTLLKTDFRDLPQAPRWVDGSGLSRYNLFTPQDMVAILDKMRTSFGMERMKVILATGGTGTLSSYFKADAGYIFAKTGSLSGVATLSGYLYTRKNRLLIFSILVNNTRSSTSSIRKAEERFLEDLRNRF